MRRALLVLLVLPLAACSSTEARVVHALAPKASVQRAVTKTAAATSEHMTLDASGSKGMFSGSVTGSGDFDNASHRGSFHLDVSGYGSIDAVVDGTSAYVKAPFLASFLPAGKTWLKLNARRAAFKVVPQNPKQALARLKKLAHVRVVGDETIDGVDTTHYHGAGPHGHVTFDVWVGKGDGYVRRIHAAESGKKRSGDLTVSFSQFGEPVSITVPPASDTVDGTKLIPYLRRG
jgi:Predicted periplasmic protein (DUF2092)